MTADLKEEILWSHSLQTGIFRKKIIETLVVTDKRVIKQLPQSNQLFTLLLSQIDSIQVLNQRRDSTGSMTMTGVRTDFDIITYILL